MNLRMPSEGLAHYSSASQRARVSSESWAARELYCPRCTSDSLEPLPRNTPVTDFRCPGCHSGYQLKSACSAFRNGFTDGAYTRMQAAIQEGRTPNLFLLQYQLDSLTVSALTFIPDFAFTISAVQRRRPLAPTARRAGWIGCNILLSRIPRDARIAVIDERHAVPVQEVRKAFRRLKPLACLRPEKRGWTLDVLNVLRSLQKTHFNLADIYAHERFLSELHPNNFHIRDKIRQQLQVLRDLNFLEFLGEGSYRMH